jgi:hypothetical protein
LGIKSTFVIRSSLPIMFHNNQIWSRSIQWSRIAPFTTKIVYLSIPIRLGFSQPLCFFLNEH